MPLPLYLRKFSNIYEPTKEYNLANEILWTLKKGFAVASLGLHTERSINEKGKSYILNQIFYTNFEKA